MRPIIFARVADMKYYKGITKLDQPSNGGSYVNETGRAHEAYNFDALHDEEDGEDYCIGFVMMASSSKSGECQLHIERMNGCQIMDGEETIDGVTVVWCSKAPGSQNMRVVGFYRNATVYRYAQEIAFENGDYQIFNFLAKKEECVLLPYRERHSNSKWYVPSSHKNNATFGFGRSNIWYASGCSEDHKQKEFVEKMIMNIDSYEEENWIDKGGIA